MSKTYQPGRLPAIQDMITGKVVLVLEPEEYKILRVAMGRSHRYMLRLLRANYAREPQCGHNAKIYKAWREGRNKLIHYEVFLGFIRQKMPPVKEEE